MDHFIVSARKYRPQNFSSVVGQSHVTTTLKNAVKNHQLAHSYLFCGPRGVGKTTCARILAKTINCINQDKEGEACNQCASCISFNEGTSLNLHELDAASNNSVDDIRALVEQVRFAPQAGQFKVYIIDEVHMLSSSAFNAFLKTLEEPPPYAIFILATTEKHKILPTILSRCQIFDFRRITVADTVEHLQVICNREQIESDKASLQIISQKSEGCMRDALSILDTIVSFSNGRLSYQQTLEHLNILDADYYFKLLDAMLKQQLSEAMLLYDDIDRKGFEGDLVLNGLGEFLRNLLVCRDPKAGILLDVVEGFKERYVGAAKDLSPAYLISALQIVNESEINYRMARNKRLHVEMTLIKLCYLQQAVDWATNGEQAVKKKIVETARPVAYRALRPSPMILQPSARPAVARQNDIPGGPIRSTVAAAQEPAPAPSPPPVKSETSLGALSKIRQQVVKRQNQEEAPPEKPLVLEALQEAWNLYAARLLENKHSAAQSVQRARLRLLDPHSFEVLANNNLEQRFIEQQKRQLCDFLQQALANKSLTFAVIAEKNTGQEEPVERNLSKREQYQQIIEQYPLVKELKDRWKLELDY